MWFTNEAIGAWKAEARLARGGQRRYSALAILTALTLRTVFRLVLRQTEGLISSIIHLLGLALAIPDHITCAAGSKRWRCHVHAPLRHFPRGTNTVGTGFANLVSPNKE